MRQAQFPDGDVVIIAPAMVVTVASTAVTVALAGSTVKSFTCQSAAGALSMQAQLQAIPDTTDGSTTVLVDALPMTLVTISPSPFAIQTDTITIRGTSFSRNTGLLHLEDGGGGVDDNGPTMKVTWVNAETLTAVFNSLGDGIMPVGDALLYYIDGDGNRSNVLTATTDGAYNVTMPAPGVSSQPSGPSAYTYKANPIGSDANPANANKNGSTVTITGGGFKGTHGAFLVNGTDVIPVTFLSSTTIQAKLPAYAASTQTFDYRYLDSDGNQQTITGAIAITFS